VERVGEAPGAGVDTGQTSVIPASIRGKRRNGGTARYTTGVSMASIKEIFEQLMDSGLKAHADRAKGIGASFQFKLTGDEAADYVVDATVPEVRAGIDDGADVTISLDSADFIDIWEGRLQGTQAFMMGKLQVEGDIMLATQLGELLEMAQD
jgi:putative sterol carrier protein